MTTPRSDVPDAVDVVTSIELVSYLDAIKHALWDELNSDDSVLLLGQDIGTMGGAFKVTQGLIEKFGASRVVDSPLAETAMVGAGIGLAIMGMRPIVELQFADFISCAYDQLVNGPPNSTTDSESRSQRS